MKKFDLKRETPKRIETILSNSSYEDCIRWIEEVLERNEYKYEVMTDLHMRPVYRVFSGKYGEVNKIFFLSEI